jgi:hypothetical protein
MRRAAVIAALAVLALGTGVVFVPFLANKDEIFAGTPVPPPLPGRETTVSFTPGERICLDSVAVTPDTAAGRVVVGTYGRRGQPLALEVSGRGYRSRAVAAGSYEDSKPVEFSFQPPDHELLATVCIRNEGLARAALYATAGGHEAARPAARSGGTAVAAEPGLVLLEARRQPLAARLIDALSRMALFRPGGAWLSWLLAGAALLAIVAGPLLALGLTSSDKPSRN